MDLALESEFRTIEAGRTSQAYVGELWRYRSLLQFLAWRDLAVRYKQTVLGVLWALLQSVATVATFSFVFGHVAKLPSGSIPYPLFVLAGSLPWSLFAGALSQGGGSLVANSQLISKVYFPRLIIPLSALAVCAVDFCLSAALFLVLASWYHWWPQWRWCAAPAFVALALVCALGIALWLSALNVRYRDVRYAIPFILQLGLFCSPVGFSSSVVPPQWKTLFELNPLVGIIDGFRWSLLGSAPVSATALTLSVAMSVGFLVSGLWYFRRVERQFADYI